MNSVLSTYIRRILVVTLTTDVMGIPGWRQEIDGRYLDQTRPFQNRPM